MLVSLRGAKTDYIDIVVSLSDAGDSVRCGILRAYGLNNESYINSRGELGHDERNNLFVVDDSNPSAEQKAALAFCAELTEWIRRVDSAAQGRK